MPHARFRGSKQRARSFGRAVSYLRVDGHRRYGIMLGGGGNYGQIGDGTLVSRVAATQVTGLQGVVQVNSHVTTAFTCALRIDGTVWCWGYNFSGVLGKDPASFSIAPTPIAIDGVSNVDSIGTGYSHICAVHDGGTGLYCWGDNAYQQLGVPNPAYSWVPIEIAGPILQ